MLFILVGDQLCKVYPYALKSYWYSIPLFPSGINSWSKVDFDTDDIILCSY